MHPSSICAYYPTYSILDEIVSKNNYDTLYIYIDLKNVLQSLYMEHTIINLVENTKITTKTDTTIFTSLISFLSFHKKYSIKRKIRIKFFIFFEHGESYYHTNINKKYKISRKVDNLYGLDFIDRNLFFDIIRKNLLQIYNSFNRIPNIKVFRLLNFEADFVPYFLITRNHVERNPNIAHITYSNDHDLCQNVMDHSYIFSKSMNSKKIICKGDGMKAQLKIDKKLSDDLQPLAMAIIGDTGDDVDGIKGIGPSRLVEILPDLIKMIGNIDSLYNNVINGKPIFNSSNIIKNKYLNMVINSEQKNNLISKNLKLVSFELISRYFENPNTTEMCKRYNDFISDLSFNETVEFSKMNNVLSTHSVEFLEEDLELLYHNF